jgi:hypothetical protein
VAIAEHGLGWSDSRCSRTSIWRATEDQFEMNGRSRRGSNMSENMLSGGWSAAGSATNRWNSRQYSRSAGVIMFLVRRHAESPTLRAIFFGNAIVQIGLLPIELAAYHERVITRISGIIPNSLLHLVLASGFWVFAVRMTRTPAAAEAPRQPKQ